jgi:hypothetical protein
MTYTRHVQHWEKHTHTFHSRLVNFNKTKFTKEQINTLTPGFNYAAERDPKYYISDLIIDNENAIRYLDTKIQNTFRYLATKNVKQTMTTNTHKTLQKRHQHNVNQIKNILQRNSLTRAKADKVSPWSYVTKTH